MADSITANNHIDSTITKMILNSIKDGNLQTLTESIHKYNLDITMLKDQNDNQNSFFYAALIVNDETALPVFKFLKECGVNVNHTDKFCQTCLYYVCREGKYNCCKFLIEECGLNVNSIDLYGQTPIYYAAREGHLDVIKLLVEKGADVNLEDKYGDICMFYAVQHGHYKVVEYLIEKGADVNKVDKKKSTPLIYAEKHNFHQIAELLIQHGAIRQETKTERDRKQKKNNSNREQQKNNSINNKGESNIEEIQKPRKYILVRIESDGKKVPLTDEEIYLFKQNNPEAYNYLTNEEERKKLIERSDKSLLQYESWEKMAKKLITQLWKVKDAELFQKPVDPNEYAIYDYFDVIKQPMDFSTIKKKLNSGKYTNFGEFDSDIQLTFDNCYKYNGVDSQVGHICTNVKNEYIKIFSELGMQKFM